MHREIKILNSGCLRLTVAATSSPLFPGMLMSWIAMSQSTFPIRDAACIPSEASPQIVLRDGSSTGT